MSISEGNYSSRRQSAMSATSRESAVSRASSGVGPAVTGEKRESTFGDMQVSIDKVFFKKCISYLFWYLHKLLS